MIMAINGKENDNNDDGICSGSTVAIPPLHPEK